MVQVMKRPHGSRGQQDERGRYLSGQMSATSAKTDPASDPRGLHPDASNIFSASYASCAS